MLRGIVNQKKKMIIPKQKKYDIKNTWRTGAILQLLKGICNMQIRNLRYPLSFIYYTLLSLKKEVRK